jgi:hypothetical protein
LSTLIVLVLGYECKHGEREEMREGEGGGRRRRMPPFFSQYSLMGL